MKETNQPEPPDTQKPPNTQGPPSAQGKKTRLFKSKGLYIAAWLAGLGLLMLLPSLRTFFEHNEVLAIGLIFVPPIAILLPWSDILGALGELKNRIGLALHQPTPAVQPSRAKPKQWAIRSHSLKVNQGCLISVVIVLLIIIASFLIWSQAPQWICNDLVRALGNPALAAVLISVYAILVALLIKSADSSQRRGLAALPCVLFMVFAVRIYLVLDSTPNLHAICAQPTPPPIATSSATSAVTPTSNPGETLMPTVTPIPTRTATPSSTPTLSPPPSYTPTSIPNPSRTPTPALLSAPNLIKPGNDSNWPQGFVQFEWTWDGNLSDNRWYLVRVGRDPNLELQTATAKTWEKGTSWVTSDLGGPTGWYYAYAVVIGTKPGDAGNCGLPYIYEAGKNVCFREISARSETKKFFFTFKPPSDRCPSWPHC
jgi:hypothetical protein